MVVKINSKPILVKESDPAERTFDPVLLCVSTSSMLMALYVLDYVCFLFLSIHPFPFMSWLAGAFAWLL